MSSQLTSQLLTDGLRLLGVVASGETPTANELNDALRNFNDMLEEWSTENMAVWATANQTFQTVQGQAVYTIGPTGDWDTTRPINLSAAYCSFNGVDFPILMIGQDKYNDIALKTQQQQIIETLLYVNEYPLGLITLWPVPAAVVDVTLSFGRVIDQIAAITETVNWPPGYAKALKYNFACHVAPEYGMDPSVTIQTIANASKGKIKVANTPLLEMRYDGVFNDNGPVIWQRGY